MSHRILVLVTALVAVHCASPQPLRIQSSELPHFDSVLVCRRVRVHPAYAVPDSLRLDESCTPVPPDTFRSLLLSASPMPPAMWKGGCLVVARSEAGGDRYYYASAYGGFFVRPGESGTQALPEERRAEWEALVFGSP
jgi:hypothetical protein